jgi:filamentous hemagglutinin family protein
MGVWEQMSNSGKLWKQKHWIPETACLMGFLGAIACAPVSAQISPDNTLGAESSRVVQNAPVRGANADRVEGGAIRGTNLFHSFSAFNINEGQRVYFANPSGIENILSRVTGNEASNLLGTLGVEGGANLFLLNPNGIIFGRNARLDISGSFTASTSDRFVFPDGSDFSAIHPQSSPLLTVNAPVPLGLQFEGNSSSSIANQASLSVGRNLTLAGGTVLSTGSLNAPAGQLTVTAAGDAQIRDITAQTATLFAGGNLVLDASQIHTTGDLNLLAQGTVSAQENVIAPFRTDVGGNLLIQGQQGINLSDATLPEVEVLSAHGNIVLRSPHNIIGDAYYDAGGDVTIDSGGSIRATGQIYTHLQSLDGGNVRLNANGNILLGTIIGGQIAENGNFVTNRSGGNIDITSHGMITVQGGGIYSDVSGGRAGNIHIQARSIHLSATRISANTAGAGRGGDITIDAAATIEMSGTTSQFYRFSRILSSTLGSGNAGNIRISAQRLILRDGAEIATSVGNVDKPQGSGNGGNVTINADDLELSGTALDPKFPSLISTGTLATGNAGNLRINTQRLRIEAGALISTDSFNPFPGSGRSGDLLINATESVELRGISASRIPSDLSTDTFGSGGAGILQVNTQRLVAQDGGVISASTFGSAPGGRVVINADRIELSGTAPRNGMASGIYAQSFGTGRAGNITINTGQLTVRDRAIVTTASGSAADARVPIIRILNYRPATQDLVADAGTLTVTADSIALDRQGSLLASTASGEGGNIQLQVQDGLLLRGASRISATAQQVGNGGNISINIDLQDNQPTRNNLLVVAFPSENSDITANASTGSGGRVEVAAQGIFGTQFRAGSTPLSDITASSEFGTNGVVEITTPGIDPSQGLAALPEARAETGVSDRCSATKSQSNSQSNSQATVAYFDIGQGGLPPRPDEALSAEAIMASSIPLDLAGTQSTSSVQLPLAPATSQAWNTRSGRDIVLTATPFVMPLLTPPCHAD